MAKELEQIRQRVRESLKRRDSDVARFGAELKSLLRTELPRVLRGVKTGRENARQAGGILLSLEDTMNEAGLNDLYQSVTRLHIDELSDVKAALEATTGRNITLATTDLESLETLIKFDTGVISNRVEQYLGGMKPVLMQQIIAGQEPDLTSLLDTDEPRLLADIKTEIDTSLNAFNRTVNVTKAEELGLEFFLYLGPDDQVTRPFCEARVNKAWTMAELEAMDNGQGLPVPQYLGGYNCRHQLRPVDAETAKQYRE